MREVYNGSSIFLFLFGEFYIFVKRILQLMHRYNLFSLFGKQTCKVLNAFYGLIKLSSL